MRPVVLNAVFLLGCGLSGRQARAQQGPVGLLPPKSPAVVVPAPALGALVTTAPPTRSVAPVSSSPAAAPTRKISEPLYTLDKRVVVGNYFLRTLNPTDIRKIMVYKGQDAPAPLRGLTENGIIDITLKKHVRLPAKSMAQLARQLRVRQKPSYLLNGMPLMGGKLRVATQAIEEIKVVRSTTGTTLSVWLFRRHGSPAAPASPHPPGTIMIRGVASY